MSPRRLNFYGRFKRGKIAKKYRESRGIRLNRNGQPYKEPSAQT